MKKITIIHQHFRHVAQGGAIRSYHLAKALQQSGWEVQILTGRYQGPEDDHLSIIALDIGYTSDFNFWQRIWSFYSFARAAKKWCQSHVDTGLLYLISTPLTVPWIGYKLRKPYIVEVGDLWPDVPIQMGFIKNPLLKKWLLNLEHKIYKHSLGIVALSPAIAAAIEQKGHSRPMGCFTNLAELDFYPNEKPLAGGGKDAPFRILYAGAMGQANGLDRILKMASSPKIAGKNLHFVLMGDGPERSKLQAMAGHLEHVTFLPFGDKYAVRQELEKAHAMLIAYADFPLLSSGSPNKFYDGLAGGKLILLTVDGWMKRLVDDYACGFSFRPEETEAFLSKLEPYLNDIKLLQDAADNARRLALDQFDKVKVLRANVAFIEDLSLAYGI
jgi:glycosyltransferase involved in cell wall biosynthesis